MVTMLLGGLWHGAAWTFVVWGGIHGLWLGLHRAILSWRSGAAGTSSWLKVLKWLVTFHLVCLTWLAFRSDSLRGALALLERLGADWRLTDYSLTCLGMLGFFLLPWLAYEAWLERRGDDDALLKVGWVRRAGFYLYLVLMLLFFPPPVPAEFIYFRF
jgi:hypothetical protein